MIQRVQTNITQRYQLLKDKLHRGFIIYDRMPLFSRSIIMLGVVAVLLGVPGTVAYIAGQQETKHITTQPSSTSLIPTPTTVPSDTPTPSLVIKAGTPVTSTGKVIVSVTPTPTSKPATTPTMPPAALTATPTSIQFVINSISPASGPIMTSITVVGKGFGNEKGDLIFCPNQCDSGAPIDSWTDTEIKGKVPGIITIAKTMSVYVRTKSGASSNKVDFTVTAGQPVVNDPTGNAIIPAPGKELVLHGVNFGTAGKVEFYKTFDDRAKLAEATGSWSDTEIHITIPTNLQAGTYYGITVVNTAGNAQSSQYIWRTDYYQ